jgi:DNA-binding CsgD family transcriptional regulator
VRLFPLAGIVGGLTALAGALANFDPGRPLVSQIPVTVFFCLVWSFLGLLLNRILQEVVIRLSHRPPTPLLVVTPGFCRQFGLTPRETAVAQAVLDGLTYQGAGVKLFISPATVKSHVLSVYRKTGAGNKIELLRLVEAENGRIHQTVDGAAIGSGGS